jgi:hypothetical protein
LLVAVLAGTSIVLAPASSFAQEAAPNAQPDNLWVYVASTADKQVQAAVKVSPSEPSDGGAWAAVPATAWPGATASATRFVVRAWREGERVRVVVSAASQGEQETQIRTEVLPPQHVVRVHETEGYRAMPIEVYVIELPR